MAESDALHGVPNSREWDGELCALVPAPHRVLPNSSGAARACPKHQEVEAGPLVVVEAVLPVLGWDSLGAMQEVTQEQSLSLVNVQVSLNLGLPNHGQGSRHFAAIFLQQSKPFDLRSQRNFQCSPVDRLVLNSCLKLVRRASVTAISAAWP